MKVGFINIYEGCLYTEESKRFDYHYYFDLIHNEHFDIIGLAEAPIDDEHHDSQFVSNLAKDTGLSYYQCHAADKAFIGSSQYSGIALLSRFPIHNYAVTPYWNPGIDLHRPDGTIWHTHDKFIQTATVNIEGTSVAIINTHTLPLTIFGYQMDSPYGKKIFETLNTTIEQPQSPKIILGDFNNKTVPLPTLLSDNSLQFPTLNMRTSTVDDSIRGAYIVISKEFTVLTAKTIPSKSDCYLLSVEVSL